MRRLVRISLDIEQLLRGCGLVTSRASRKLGEFGVGEELEELGGDESGGADAGEKSEEGVGRFVLEVGGEAEPERAACVLYKLVHRKRFCLLREVRC